MAIFSDVQRASIIHLFYNLRTVWLFTYSDLKTIVIPTTAFGVFNAFSAEIFGNPSPPPSNVVSRIPHVLFWTWSNLLPFAIDNQRQTEAIKEDSINKPWRPLPSRRIQPTQAKVWMMTLYPVAIASSLYLGGIRQSVGLLAVGIWYNDLGGADQHPLIRNFINACGFLCYISGSMEVALDRWIPFENSFLLLLQWLCIIGVIVFTTVHTQDMYDQAGDKLRGRLTVHLCIGDEPSRVSIAILMPVWSCVVPWFWEVTGLAFVVLLFVGCTVSVRTLRYRSVQADKQTFRLWNLWLIIVYCMPLLKDIKPLS